MTFQTSHPLVVFRQVEQLGFSKNRKTFEKSLNSDYSLVASMSSGEKAVSDGSVCIAVRHTPTDTITQSRVKVCLSSCWKLRLEGYVCFFETLLKGSTKHLCRKCGNSASPLVCRNSQSMKGVVYTCDARCHVN